MRIYRVVDKDRFSRFIRMVMLIVVAVLVVLFIKFMNAHNGLGPKTIEYHTYEIVQQTSSENHRIKEPVTREVVYKYIYQ